MALGTFTVGRDAQAVFVAPNGTRIDLTGLTDFTWTPVYQRPRTQPLSGPPIERYLPNGHTLRFAVDRTGPANDTLIASIEAGWWAVGSADAGTSNNGSAFIYLTETDGSVTTYQFSGVSMGMTAGGDFRTDQPVKQTIEGHAQRMSVL